MRIKIDFQGDGRRKPGFVGFALELVAELRGMGRARLADHYRAAVSRFSRFMEGREVAFSELDAPLMESFECRLKEEGLCPNSTSYYMRNLRAIYNKAVERGVADCGDPFRKVYTGVARTLKRAVSLDVIRRLRSMDLSDDPVSAMARDLFLFSFYTRGMAIVDMAFLRCADLKGDFLVYRRRKTGQRLTVRWEAPMAEIAARYAREGSEYMFPLIDSAAGDPYRQYRVAYNRLLRRLRKIGERLRIAEPLTFHRSRHSWASIARAHGVPLPVISEGMGHDSERTTRIYLESLDNSVVDNANLSLLRLLEA